jgi:hypothetical protein
MSTPALLMEPRGRRRAGSLLLVFGLVGSIVLGGLFLVLGYAALRVDSSLTRVSQARDQVVLILDHASAALTTAGGITGNLSDTVTHTSAAVEGGAEVAAQLSGTTSSLAGTASTFGILGQHPFAGVSDGLQQTSSTLEQMSQQLAAAATSLGASAPQVATVGDKLTTIAADLDAIRAQLAGLNLDLEYALLLVLGVLMVLIAWLLVPALTAIWLGRRWRREAAAGMA